MCSAVQLCWRRSSARGRALVHVSFCSEAQLSEMCLERFLVCVCVLSGLNAFGCLRYAEECEARRGRKRETFASLNYLLLVFCALAVVVNFSVRFCRHVRFPVDHALPPPHSTHLRFLITLTHTPLFVWVCTDGREFPQKAPDWLAAEGL